MALHQKDSGNLIAQLLGALYGKGALARKSYNWRQNC